MIENNYTYSISLLILTFFNSNFYCVLGIRIMTPTRIEIQNHEMCSFKIKLIKNNLPCSIIIL